jgi:hypothetical protein
MILHFLPLLFLAISQFFCLCNLVFITKCIFATGQLKTYILVKTFIAEEKKEKGCILLYVISLPKVEIFIEGNTKKTCELIPKRKNFNYIKYIKSLSNE